MWRTAILAGLGLVAACASAERPGTAAATATRDLEIVSGDVRLAGAITAPGGAAPRAGVVLLAGSGPASREMLRPSAELLAARGLAAVYYDKRGVGGSGGDWTTSSLADLASDAIAARDALAAETGLDPRDIGLWGHSQGVWVAAKAVELGAEPAFVLAVSGGGVGPRASEADGYRRALLHAGARGAGLAEGETLVATYFDYLAGAVSRAELEAARDAVAERTWADALRFPIPSEAGRAAWAWVATFDPAPAMAASDAPVLVVLGGRDAQLPVDATAAAWRETLARSPARGDRIVMLPEVDHHLNAPAAHDGAASGHGAPPGLNPDPAIWDELAEFAAAHAGPAD